MQHKKQWSIFAGVVLSSFAVLGYYGSEIYRTAPPIPGTIVSPDGRVLFTAQQIRDGQNVWQSMGGQEVGSIWGHGAYVAPDWSADWLHRESLLLLDGWAQAQHHEPYSELPAGAQARLRQQLSTEIRTNTYDPVKDQLLVSNERADAIEAMATYYEALFSGASEFPEAVQSIADGGYSAAELRDAYAIAHNSVPDSQRRHLMSGFFFWAAWTTATERPGSLNAEGRGITYTNNWPPEPLIENRPTSSIIVWSVLSFIMLLAGVGILSWYNAVAHRREEEENGPTCYPERDPLSNLVCTPSMKATLKYFWVVAALMVLQVILGGITAHYGVEGNGFYGIPLAEYLPYSVARTWHTQLGIFWIATAWLATGLFIAPAVSKHEPIAQRFGVNFLFVSLLIIVVGSMFGTWYGVQQRLSLEANFWFGHQGYEYVDLGRFWQSFLVVGLFLWAALVIRALWPAFKKGGDQKSLLGMFMISTVAIGMFYAAGLMWGRQTHLAIAEYWRWWVVHLWVEGFFEVFATVAIAFLFWRLGLLNKKSASRAVIFSSTLFLGGGIIGTFHHLYFTGTPTAVLAFGSVFSALEIVPLVLVGAEAYANFRLTKARPWVSAYQWPIYFFVGVAFWNLVGAGLFGFLINPPIALYYVQGLNTTPLHGHTALFGVYGLLGIGLMLFTLRMMSGEKQWRTGALRIGFWGVNIGLVLMAVLSLLPIGLMQAWASVEHGMWYARSAEFLQGNLMNNLRWMRALGDIAFAGGIVSLAWFVVGLQTGWSFEVDKVTDNVPLDKAA